MDNLKQFIDHAKNNSWNLRDLELTYEEPETPRCVDESGNLIEMMEIDGNGDLVVFESENGDFIHNRANFDYWHEVASELQIFYEAIRECSELLDESVNAFDWNENEAKSEEFEQFKRGFDVMVDSVPTREQVIDFFKSYFNLEVEL
jgi:hypothetical protein